VSRGRSLSEGQIPASQLVPDPDTEGETEDEDGKQPAEAKSKAEAKAKPDSSSPTTAAKITSAAAKAATVYAYHSTYEPAADDAAPAPSSKHYLASPDPSTLGVRAGFGSRRPSNAGAAGAAGSADGLDDEDAAEAQRLVRVSTSVCCLYPG
jgi:hypothetical protein